MCWRRSRDRGSASRTHALTRGAQPNRGPHPRRRGEFDAGRTRLQLLPQPVSPAELHAPHPVAPLLEARRWSRLCRLLDLIVLCSASAAAIIGESQLWALDSNRLLVAAFPPLVLSVLYIRGSGEDALNHSLFNTAASVLGSLALSALILLAADSVIGGTHVVALTLRVWGFCAAALVAERAILTSVRSAAMRVPALVTPTLVIGAGKVGDHIVRRLLAEPRYGLRPVGFLDSNPLPNKDGQSPIPVLGDPQDLGDAIEHTGARHVILAFSGAPDFVMLAHVRECERLGVTVSLVPRLFESINQRASLGHVGGVPLLTLREVNPRGWQFTAKHFADSFLAAIVLVALAPLMATLALIVKLSSPGPILFRQRRIGRDGHPFDLLKFRTMRLPVGDEAVRFELPRASLPAASRVRTVALPSGAGCARCRWTSCRSSSTCCAATCASSGRDPSGPSTSSSSSATSAATRIATASSRASPAGHRFTGCVARPRSRSASSSTTTTSRTGRSGSTCGFWRSPCSKSPAPPTGI